MRKPSFFRVWYIHYSVLVLLLLLICSFVEATAATREIDTDDVDDDDGDEVSDEIYTEVVIWEDLLLEPFGHDDDDTDYTSYSRRTRSFLPSAVAEPALLGPYAVRYFDHDRETLKYRL